MAEVNKNQRNEESYSWQFMMMVGAIAVTGVVVLLKLLEII